MTTNQVIEPTGIEEDPAGDEPGTLPLDPAVLLAKAVEVSTRGAACSARPGQALLSTDIVEAFETGRPLAGIAPTGTGKSFAYLAPAVAAWVNERRRTLVTTGGLGLQDQLDTKDLPVMAEALRQLGFDAPLRWAVRKGFANYPCKVRVQSSFEEACQASNINTRQEDAEALEDLEKWIADSAVPFECTPREFVELLKWAMSDSATERADAPHVSDAAWRRVSCSSDECVVPKCPHEDDCPAIAARNHLSKVSIVITNHHTLALQPTAGVPVLLGSKRLGQIHQVVVDEAHALPQIVRDQGAAHIDGKRILRIVRLLGAAADTKSPGVWADSATAGRFIAGQFDEAVLQHHPDGSPTRKLTDGDPLVDEDAYEHVRAWASSLGDALNEAIKRQDDIVIGQRLTTAMKAVDGLYDDIDNLTSGRAGWARWVERDHNTIGARPRVCISPVSVAPLLERFWGWQQLPGDPTAPMPKCPLPVVAVSATLPPSTVYDLGLPQPNAYKAYASPFAEAYKESAIFIPRADPNQVPPPVRGGTGRALDTGAHAEWAAPLVTELVTANAGSALVLAATTRAGRLYTGALSRALEGTGIEVISQWSAGNATRAVEQWRNSGGGVLVGTRSLMTGVDAPGHMCSLVVIDRSPRSMGNPVDDARVEAIRERMQLEKWVADRYVYVADAALLLEQAAGRLVRRESDRGVVAVLDPRLLEDSPIASPEPTRQAYMGALEPFGKRTSNLDLILRFLRENAAARQPAEAA